MIVYSQEVEIVAAAYGVHPGLVEVCDRCELLAPPLHPGCGGPDPQRGTGRTTRMLEEAVWDAAFPSNYVMIKVLDFKHRDLIENMSRQVVMRLARGSSDSQDWRRRRIDDPDDVWRRIHPVPDCDVNLAKTRGIHYGTILEDHHYTETRERAREVERRVFIAKRLADAAGAKP